jgi:hypothetical protein
MKQLGIMKGCGRQKFNFFCSILHVVILLACMLCVFDVIFFHKSGATNLSSVIERVPCY